MAEESKDERLPIKKLLQGSVLILISNLIYIGNNYLVAWTKLTAPEIALVKGGIQVIIFGIIVWRSEGSTRKENEEPKKKKIFLYFLMCLYGFSVSTMSFACLAAIQFMPIGDLIVICFASPVFSVFLDRIVLKRALTFLSVFLCLLIIIGDVLVVQPPFLFGESASIHNSTQNSTESVIEKHGDSYYLGIALCVYGAAAQALGNILGAHCNKKNISTSHLMLVSGISSFLLSLISSIFISNRLLTAPQSLSFQAAILLPVLALLSMVAYWTITLAVSVTRHPTLITMLRSTEIPISLVTESLWWNQMPGIISLVGSLLVTACVLSMSAHDNIVMATKALWRKLKRTNEESDLLIVKGHGGARTYSS